MYKNEPLNLNPFAAVFVQAVLAATKTGLFLSILGYFTLNILP